jgi:hypothetical protein
MKQIIVLAAILPLLMAFVMQYSLEQSRHHMTLEAEESIRYACSEAEELGGFTPEISSRLRTELAGKLGISADSIGLDLDEPESAEPITYKIVIPIGKIISANKLFGIKDADNRMRLLYEGRLAHSDNSGQ